MLPEGAPSRRASGADAPVWLAPRAGAPLRLAARTSAPRALSSAAHPDEARTNRQGAKDAKFLLSLASLAPWRFPKLDSTATTFAPSRSPAPWAQFDAYRARRMSPGVP